MRSFAHEGIERNRKQPGIKPECAVISEVVRCYYPGDLREAFCDYAGHWIMGIPMAFGRHISQYNMNDLDEQRGLYQDFAFYRIGVSLGQMTDAQKGMLGEAGLETFYPF